MTYYILSFMSMLHLVWDLKTVPEWVLYPQAGKLAESERYVGQTTSTTMS